jgi:hypothetical protein
MKSVPIVHNPLETLHLYRALLREATYLPDRQCRAYFRQYIADRFRRNADILRTEDAGSSKLRERQQQSHLPENRLRTLIRNAKLSLRQLHRANEGEMQPLLNVLMHAYGRTGRRRRELLEHLLVPDEQPEQQGRSIWFQDTELQNYLYTDKRFSLFFEPPKIGKGEIRYRISDRFSKLKALAISQIGQGGSLPKDSRGRLKSIEMVMPAENQWGRQMPRKRSKNKVKLFHAQILDKLHVPLPRKEWDRLQALVNGSLKWEGVVKKRPGNIVEPNALQGHEAASMLAIADAIPGEIKPLREKSPKLYTTGMRRARDEESIEPIEKAVLEHSLGIGYSNTKTRRARRPHHITTQFMRRMWARILAQSCLIEWDVEKNKWMFQWGAKIAAPVATEGALYTGVDSNGKLLKLDEEEMSE